jgi:hypothetical protein
MTNILLKLQTHMRIVNAYENCKAHINVPHETMKRESKYSTNDKMFHFRYSLAGVTAGLYWVSFFLKVSTILKSTEVLYLPPLALHCTYVSI